MQINFHSRPGSSAGWRFLQQGAFRREFPVWPERMGAGKNLHRTGFSIGRVPPPGNSGLYVLLIFLEADCTLAVGALGEFRLPGGQYLYCGSARSNLRQRVARHLSSRKAIRWHIDHLTSAAPAVLQGALFLDARGLSECALNRAVGALAGAHAPVPRFGASDCRSGCAAHLWRTSHRLTLENLAGFLREALARTPA